MLSRYLILLALVLTVGILPALSTEPSEPAQEDKESSEPAMEESSDDEEHGEELEEELELDTGTLEPAPDLVFDDKPVYKIPVPIGDVHFSEPFADVDAIKSRWVQSAALNGETGKPKYDGNWAIEEASHLALEGDLGLVLMNPNTHHALSAELTKPFEFTGKPLVVQYEVKFQKGQACGGAYIKLLRKPETGKLNLAQFDASTPYTIMFGPDRCGKDAKVHFIIQHRNPKTGKYEEKHARRAEPKIDDIFSDHKTHLFTLVLNADNSYAIYMDQGILTSGNLLYDLTPPVNPPREISDPNDTKPVEWDDREKIPDPSVKKPDDWDETEPEMITDDSAVKPSDWLDDEPLHIPDPKALKPSDWSDEDDGQWEANLIDNPACKSVSGCGAWSSPLKKNPKYRGVWSPPLIDNPDYDGKWVPRMIDNPDYFEDNEPYKLSPIVAVGLELWSISDGIFFDNFIITDSREVADRWADDGWRLKRAGELHALGRSVYDVVLDLTHGRPWLYPVLALIILIPLLLFLYWCCYVAAPPSDVTYTFGTASSLLYDHDGDEDGEDHHGNDNEEERESEEASDIEEIRKAENKTSSKQKPKSRSGGGDNSNLNEPMRSKSELETTPTSAEGEGPTVASSEYVDSHSDDADDEDIDDDKEEVLSSRPTEGSTARRRKMKSRRD